RFCFFFFFQAEDGIRDFHVTGVQTCALPIYFHLVLPPRYNTNLSGRVELYTDDLRYRAGAVDTRHDSQATLEHVATDYLQRRHATRQVQLESFPAVRFPATSLLATIQARVDGQQQTYELPLGKGAQGWAVAGDEYPPLPAEPEPVAPQVSTRAEEAPAPTPRLDRRQRFSMERLLRDP